ncbi:MAG: S-layer homology domain-containing protein [Actinomycetota bacterium]
MFRRITAGALALTVAAGVASLATPAFGVAGFGDVQEGRFYDEPVQWMVDNDITTGTSETCFSPEDPVTRGQLAAFMWRMEGSPSAPDHSFTDVSAPWQQGPVSWMVDEKITTGTSTTTYSPDDRLTRGQLAALMHRLAGEPDAGAHGFGDVVASWQQLPVGWMVENGITTGTSDSTFSPNDTVTRGQLAAFFYRYKGSPAVELDASTPPCPLPASGEWFEFAGIYDFVSGIPIPQISSDGRYVAWVTNDVINRFDTQTGETVTHGVADDRTSLTELLDNGDVVTTSSLTYQSILVDPATGDETVLVDDDDWFTVDVSADGRYAVQRPAGGSGSSTFRFLDFVLDTAEVESARSGPLAFYSDAGDFVWSAGGSVESVAWDPSTDTDVVVDGAGSTWHGETLGGAVWSSSSSVSWWNRSTDTVASRSLPASDGAASIGLMQSAPGTSVVGVLDLTQNVFSPAITVFDYVSGEVIATNPTTVSSQTTWLGEFSNDGRSVAIVSNVARNAGELPGWKVYVWHLPG